MAKGLYSMHEEGVIHYALNTMNILLTKEKNVKIADFGMGRSVADQEAWQSTAVPNAVPWMAPEVLQPCRGLPGSLASDVWSLSTIIWEVSQETCGMLEPHTSVLVLVGCHVGSFPSSAVAYS